MPEPVARRDDVRSELQRLGYLTHGFERFFLQDALRRRPPWRALMGLAAREALLGGPLVAAVLAIGLAAVNGGVAAHDLSLIPLWIHLLPVGAGVVVGFFLLAAVLVWLLVRTAPHRLSAVSTAVGVLVVGAGTLAAGWPLRHALAGLEATARTGLVVATVIAALLLARVVSQGLVGWAVRLTDRAPARRVFGPRAALAGGLLVTAAALTPLFFLPSRAVAVDPVLPERRGDTVLLVGIDGLTAEEFDYFKARDGLPAISRLLREGGRLVRYRREEQAPASFWTTVATGLDAERHGVLAVDGFEPLGTRWPLLRLGPMRPWFERVAAPLGLARQRAVLANRRGSRAIWDLAARGGGPVVVVNWWSTFPAEPVPGLMVAHGAYQLLGLETGAAVSGRVVGSIAPVERTDQVLAWAQPGLDQPSLLSTALEAAIGGQAGQALVSRSLAPDVFHRSVLKRGTEEFRPRFAALYLPALDILREGWTGSPGALGDALRVELSELDTWLAEVAPRFDSVLVVFDPGRSLGSAAGSGSEGRALVWSPRHCPPGVDAGVADAAAPAFAALALRLLGLPQSAELPEPPELECRWTDPPARVHTYGERTVARGAVADEEYLESLRSLGYL